MAKSDIFKSIDVEDPHANAEKDNGNPAISTGNHPSVADDQTKRPGELRAKILQKHKPGEKGPDLKSKSLKEPDYRHIWDIRKEASGTVIIILGPLAERPPLSSDQGIANLRRKLKGLVKKV